MDHKLLANSILTKFSKTKWIKFSFVCVLSVAAAIGTWNLFFEDTFKNTFKNTLKNYNTIQLSSIAKESSQVRLAEMASMNRLSAKPLLNKQSVKKIPKRFAGNPAFKLFVFIDELVNTQDSKTERKPTSLQSK